MINTNESFYIIFFAALVAGQAVHYFISGESSANSITRNALVALQLVLALGALIWGWKRQRNSRKCSAGTM